jgi:TP901 family phage tail tape measure protein
MANSAVVGILRAILMADTAQFDQAMNRSAGTLKSWTKDINSFGRNAKKIGTTLTEVLTVPIVGIGTAAVTAGLEFERTLNQVAAVTDATAGDMKALSDAAQEWGAKTKFSNTEAAQAMLDLGKAGFTAKQTIEALPSVLQLATAANMDLGTAATLTANVMQTFGLQMTDLAHANDILVTAANASTIDVADLQEGLKFVGPVARAAHVSLSDVAAAMAELGGAGIKGEMGGTALRGMISKLLAPSDQLSRMLAKLGFQEELNAGKTVGWTQMLDALHAKFGEGQAVVDQYSGMIMKGFGQRAGPAVIALAQSGGEAVRQLSAQFDATTGSAQRMSDAFMKGLPGAFENAKGSIETMFAAIETALSPTLEKVANDIMALANFVTLTVVPAFNSLPGPVKEGTVVLLGLAAAAGPVIFVLGQIATAIGAILPYIPAIGTAFMTVVEVLSGPIGWIIGAATLIVVAWEKWGDDIKRIVSTAWADIKEWLWDKLQPVIEPIEGLFDSLGKMFSALGLLIGAVAEKIGGYLKSVYDAAKSWLMDKLKPVFDFLKPIFDTVSRAWSLAKDLIVGVVSALYTAVKHYLLDQFTDIVNGIKGKIDAITGFFKNMYDDVVGHSFVPDMIKAIEAWFGKLDGVMVAPTRSATHSVVQGFSDMKTEALDTIDGFLKAISGKDKLGGLKTFASGFARDFVAGFADVFAPGLGQVIEAAWPLIQSALIDIGKGIKNFFSGLFGGGHESGGPDLSHINTGVWRQDPVTGQWGWSASSDPNAPIGAVPPPNGQPAQPARPVGGDIGGPPDLTNPTGAVDMPTPDELNSDAWVAAHPQFMASGGIVNGPTLAMIGESGPEAVVPLGQSGVGTTLVLERDGREEARWFVPYFTREVQRLRLA